MCDLIDNVKTRALDQGNFTTNRHENARKIFGKTFVGAGSARPLCAGFKLPSLQLQPTLFHIIFGGDEFAAHYLLKSFYYIGILAVSSLVRVTRLYPFALPAVRPIKCFTNPLLLAHAFRFRLFGRVNRPIDETSSAY